MRTDPTDTGGLFVGRRPGTAPTRYRAQPERGSAAPAAHRRPRGARRARPDGRRQPALLGPDPRARACGSPRRCSTSTDSVWLGILLGFAGCCSCCSSAASRCSSASIASGSSPGAPPGTTSVRASSGASSPPRRSSGPSGFTFWLLFIGGLGSIAGAALMFGHYRQYEGMTEEEVSADLRAKADERKQQALARVEPLDLSATTWPEYPPSTVVNAITYAARRGLHRYLDRHATALRSELAHYLGVAEERLVVGDGAAQLLGAAAQALLEPLDELVTPWPSYGLYPVIAHRARGHAVPVPGFGAQAVLRAVNERTRLVALCNPNDPTGELVARRRAALAARARCPSASSSCSTRRCATSSTPRSATPRWRSCDEFPRLLVFRTFSKAWGLAGLRVRLRGRRPGRRAAARAARARARAQRARPGRGARGAAPCRRRGGGPRGDGGRRARAADATPSATSGCTSPPARPTCSGCARSGSAAASSPAASSATGSSSPRAARWATTPACGASIQRPEAGDRLLRALELSGGADLAARARARARSCRAAARPRGRCRGGAR